MNTTPALQATSEGRPDQNLSPMAPDQAFIHCVERLEALIETETQILRGLQPIDFETLNLRKTHALMEFLQMSRNIPGGVSLQARERIQSLQKLLAVNAETLERHLRAMQEITALVVKSIQEDASDGTYSMTRAGRR